MIAGARNITSLNVVTPDAESDDAVAPAVIPAAIAVSEEKSGCMRNYTVRH